MKLLVFIHGAEAFYSGEALKLLDKLRAFGEIKAFVTGTMARTSSLDTGFRVEVWSGRPSELLKFAEGEFDAVVIATHSKSAESGYAFGEILVRKSQISKPVLQFELSNRTAVLWNGKGIELAEKIGFELVKPEKIEKALWKEGGRVYRRILAVEPGEFLLIDGIVVGRVKEREVLIVSEGGEILELRGVEVKKHGLEKLRRKAVKLDLENIKVCTLKSFKTVEANVKGRRGVGVAFVDHSADRIYEFAGKCEGVVCVGDDTTAIASEILFRFNTPVLGIVDEDRDSVLIPRNFHPDSEVLVTKHDDFAGEIVFEKIFKGRDVIAENFASVRERIADLLVSSSLLVARKTISS